jgi:hypothetical protein
MAAALEMAEAGGADEMAGYNSYPDWSGYKDYIDDDEEAAGHAQQEPEDEGAGQEAHEAQNEGEEDDEENETEGQEEGTRGQENGPDDQENGVEDQEHGAEGDEEDEQTAIQQKAAMNMMSKHPQLSKNQEQTKQQQQQRARTEPKVLPNRRSWLRGKKWLAEQPSVWELPQQSVFQSRLLRLMAFIHLPLRMKAQTGYHDSWIVFKRQGVMDRLPRRERGLFLLFLCISDSSAFVSDLLFSNYVLSIAFTLSNRRKLIVLKQKLPLVRNSHVQNFASLYIVV